MRRLDDAYYVIVTNTFFVSVGLLFKLHRSPWTTWAMIIRCWLTVCRLCKVYDGKKIKVGVCAMAKKVKSKPMLEILKRLQYFSYIDTIIFEEEVRDLLPVTSFRQTCQLSCICSCHSLGLKWLMPVWLLFHILHWSDHAELF